MRTKLLLFVFLIGTATGIAVTLLFVGQKAMANDSRSNIQRSTSASVDWPDSLDAVVAAPQNHKVVLYYS